MSEEIIKKLQEHDQKFDTISKKLGEHDDQLDSIARTVVNHTERLKRIEENMATKSNIHEITNTLDVLVKLAQKKDQELTFMGKRVRRVEDDVKQIKPLVRLTT